MKVQIRIGQSEAPGGNANVKLPNHQPSRFPDFSSAQTQKNVKNLFYLNPYKIDGFMTRDILISLPEPVMNRAVNHFTNNDYSLFIKIIDSLVSH